ncbi:RHS repeat-associated core domain-containing protein [Kitasatospora sp. NPDC002227]|uniref:RHS repeat-associated core domain-containing protein n=1 Tax=Kitasatospora sp. NPDC002227 TaxID=3154773 RepID=UPI0033218B6E
MSNQIVKALEHAAQKVGTAIAKDASKAVKDLYHSAGKNLKKVAANVREVEEKHAKDLAKAFEGGKGEGHHPHAPKGGGPKGHGHPKGRGRDQVKDPRTEGRDHGTRKCPGEPVDIATGRMFIDQTDASLPGSLPLLFTRNFESGLLTGRWMGPKWLCTFDERLELDEQGVVHIRADRITQAFPYPEPGDPVYASAGSRHELALEDGLFTVTDPATGLVKTFTPDGDEALLTEVRDRHGRHYTLTYDPDGTPLSITHSGGYRLLVTVEHARITALRLATPDGDALLTRYGYTDGHLSSVYNSSGKPLRFANDTAGRILSWTDRNNSQYRYSYDAFDRVTDEGGTDGALRFHFTYGSPDPATGLREHTETNALGHTTTYTINHHAQVAAVTDPLGHTTTYERDEYDRLLSETDPLGRTTRYEYDGAGDPIRITRPDGERITAEYADGLSLPTLVLEPGDVVWRQTYDRTGLRTSLTGPTGAVTTYGHDELGHLASISDALGNSTFIRCNPAGLPVEITDPSGAVTRYERDSFGRATAITEPLGGVVRMAWTVEGKLSSRTAPDGTTETWTYDGEGNRLTHTDQLGQVTAFEYTHFETLAARTGPDGARHSFEHDANMRLVGVTNALGQQWTYRYDAAGRLVGECDFAGRTVEYRLDAVGQITARTNPLGQQTHYTYDLLGLTTTSETAGQITSYRYDRAGHLVRATSPTVDLVRVVDPLGNLLTESVNGRTLTVRRDVLGRRTERTTPGGHTSSWVYDASGRPTSLRTGEGTIDFAYDDGGRERRRTVSTTLSLVSIWDGMHRLTGQSLSTESGPLQERRFSYRADGRLTSVDDQLTGRRSFELDRAGRVTSVSAATWTEAYAYDPTGNLTEADWPAAGATAAALGARSYHGTQLVGAGRVRYEYDAAGRIVLRQVTRLSRKPDTWQYSWDAANRLTQVTTPDGTEWRYLYDPFGRRMAKLRLAADGVGVEEQTDFTWDGSVLAEQITTAGYLPGPHTLSWDHRGLHPIAQTERIATPARQAGSPDNVDRRFFAIVTDLVGTPTELVDTATATIAWRASTTLWGNTTWSSTSATYTPLRFPGQYFDPETRFHYNLNRYYDPETARYVTPDPLGLAPAPNPDTYVHNPHTWSDPLGLSPHPPKSRSLFRAPKTGTKAQAEHGLDPGAHGANGRHSGTAYLGETGGVAGQYAGRTGFEDGFWEYKMKPEFEQEFPADNPRYRRIHQNSRGSEEYEWIIDQEHIPRFNSLIAEAKWWNWNHDAQMGWSDDGEIFEG